MITITLILSSLVCLIFSKINYFFIFLGSAGAYWYYMRWLSRSKREIEKQEGKEYVLCGTKNLKELLKKKPILKNIFHRLLISPPGDVAISTELATTKQVILDLFKKEPLNKTLEENQLKIEDVEKIIEWVDDIEKVLEEKRRWWSWGNLVKKGSVARDWTSGFCVLLDKYSINITEQLKQKGWPEMFGHKKTVASIERVLSQKGINDVLLVGEPGVGRRSIIFNLARRMALSESLPSLNHNRIVQLDLSSLLAECDNFEKVEYFLDQMFKEALRAGNVILFIDQIHQFIGQEARPGAIDISAVLSSYLSHEDFRLIAITDYIGLHRHIEKNSNLISMLEKIETKEISEQETFSLLKKITFSLEHKYNVFIPYPAIKEVLKVCKRYLPNDPFPEKAIDLLNGAVSLVAKERKKILLKEDVDRLMTEKVQIPIGEADQEEKQKLLHLEDLLHKRIVNQKEAINEVSSSLRRARADVSTHSGPMGSFLFLGPTGVGKTETAKALADVYFGDERKMIRLDMSEFQSVNDIARLIGSPSHDGLLTTAIRENPFSLLLLDEIEKAHPDVLNIFLQILDDGYITDGIGRKVDFHHCIIISTSNAGYRIILDAFEKNKWEGLKKKILNQLFEEGTFRPEFINRFDAVVLFHPLTVENLLDIVSLQLKKTEKKLSEKGITLIIDDDVKKKLIDIGYDPVFGAREMKRVIRDQIENRLASALLEEKVKKGGKIKIDSSFNILDIS
jgi:ATP-dependent Clp protease ATP-binding subunit ClpC